MSGSVTCARVVAWSFNVAMLFALLSVSARGSEVALLPAPREAHWSGNIQLHGKCAVRVPGADADDEFAASDLEQALHSAALDVVPSTEGAYPIVLLRKQSAEAQAVLAEKKLTFEVSMEAEGYVLVVEPERTLIIGATGTGVFYGVQTFKQLLPLSGSPALLPLSVIRDWPAMKYRGIDDDLSRGPLPTLEFVEHQIRVFASYKANLYSPYFEHTLAYPGHPLIAPSSGAFSGEEIDELVRFAQGYHVTIVPEQESFGHLHQVLKYDLYADLAETPHGHVLAPGQPGTLPLIQDWFTQLAQQFPSPFLHIGADETFDLGQGRTRPAVQKQGYGPVYVDFLHQIHDALAPLHRRLIFWGDIGGADPDSVAKLPKDMIAVPWNYWDTEGFEKLIDPFVWQGIETWVAPGDANWNEVYPDSRKAFENIRGFIRDGQKAGSTGALITVWNDDGEGLFNLNWYGVLFGAVAAWQPGESSIPAYRAAYGRLFHGDATGTIDEALEELVASHAALTRADTELSSDQLFWLDPWSAAGQRAAAKILPHASELRIHAERAIERIAQIRRSNPHLREGDALLAMELGARRLDFIGMKFELAQEITTVYASVRARQQEKKSHAELSNLMDEISGINGRCQDLRDGYSALKNLYRKVWMSENRPDWLDNVTVRYDLRIELWQRRAEQLIEATVDLNQGRPLSVPEALGMQPASIGRSQVQ